MLSAITSAQKKQLTSVLNTIASSSMFYNILEQQIPLYGNCQNYIEQHSFGYPLEKYFPRPTRRSSHVWL